MLTNSTLHRPKVPNTARATFHGKDRDFGIALLRAHVPEDPTDKVMKENLDKPTCCNTREGASVDKETR